MPSSIIATHTRNVPWLGVGNTGEWDNVEDALYYGDLDYEVEQTLAYDNYGTPVPGIMVNRNRTTGDIMGVTSDCYGVVQNHEAFSLLDPFCSAGGVIEHAGMTVNGMCFMVMRLPGHAFGFQGDDFELYVCAMNSFNTRFPLALIITPVRVFCQNMFRKLMKRGDTVLLIKHGRFAADRILSASKASSLLLDYRDDFVDALGASYAEQRQPVEVESFVEKMLPLVPVTPEHPQAKTSNARIMLQREDFLNSYYYAPDNLKYTGTRLGVLNAFYDWTTHHVPMRASKDFDDIRLSGLISGTSVSNKLIASA